MDFHDGASTGYREAISFKPLSGKNGSSPAVRLNSRIVVDEHRVILAGTLPLSVAAQPGIGEEKESEELLPEEFLRLRNEGRKPPDGAFCADRLCCGRT